MKTNFNAARTEELVRSHVQARLDAGTQAGMVCGVWVGDEQKLQVTMGSRDPAAGISMTPDALFRMASMTKPVTGAAAMQLAEQGRLDLDAPVSRWLPGFAKMEVSVATPEGEILTTRPAQQQITPRMLLTHTSGLGSTEAGMRLLRQLTPDQRKDLKSAVEAYQSFPLDFQPGSTQLYSGTAGLDVLCRVVEEITGLPYAEYLQKNLLDPLEMPDTTYDPTPAQIAREVALVNAIDGKLYPTEISPRAGFVSFADGYTGGGAGLFSTLEDYSHLARMYLNGGSFRGRQILKPETVAEMARPQLPEHFCGICRYFNWGLSMRTLPEQAPADAPLPGQPLPAGSFGWSGAFGTHFWMDPSHNLTAVYLSNLLNGGGAGAPTAFEFERDVMAGLEG